MEKWRHPGGLGLITDVLAEAVVSMPRQSDGTGAVGVGVENTGKPPHLVDCCRKRRRLNRLGKES